MRRNVREFWLVIFSHATTLPTFPLSMSMMMKVKMKMEDMEEWSHGSLGAGLAPQGENEGGVRGSAAPPIFSTAHLPSREELLL